MTEACILDNLTVYMSYAIRIKAPEAATLSLRPGASCLVSMKTAFLRRLNIVFRSFFSWSYVGSHAQSSTTLSVKEARISIVAEEGYNTHL